jgi:hypothetical protein
MGMQNPIRNIRVYFQYNMPVMIVKIGSKIQDGGSE